VVISTADQRVSPWLGGAVPQRFAPVFHSPAAADPPGLGRLWRTRQDSATLV